MNEERHQVQIDGETIVYGLRYKKVGRIFARLYMDRGIVVSAPPGTPIEQVEKELLCAKEKILSFMQKRAQTQACRQQMPRNYETGEPVLYLGDYYTLKCMEAQETGISVCENGEIELRVPAGMTPEGRRRLFQAWWNKEARRVIGGVVLRIYPSFEDYCCGFPAVRFRSMVSMWGNCRPHMNLLTFNTRLLAAPVQCIEYVVIHEFHHFIVHDHSKYFYRNLAYTLPDWKARQDYLNENVRLHSPEGD